MPNNSSAGRRFAEKTAVPARLRFQYAFYLCAAVALVPLCGVQAQSGPVSAQAGLPLAGGDSIVLELPLRSSRTLSFTLCSGCFAEVRIEQLHGMISAYLAGPGAGGKFAYFLDAGIHSVIHIPVLAPAEAVYQLTIEPALGGAATVRVTLTAPRPGVPGDSDRVAASRKLAEAATIHRSRSPGSAQQATAAYEQARAMAAGIGDERLELQALLGEARVSLYRTGDYKAALRQSLDGMAIVRGWKPASETPEDLALEAFAWKQVSSAYAFLARYPEMIEATNHSLALYRRLGDTYWESVLEGNLAAVYLEIGDVQNALSSAEEALALARQLSDAPGIVFAQATLAAIHQQRGEYQAAFDADEAALRAISSSDSDEEGQIWSNLAELYDDLNDPERERDALRQALPLLRQSGDTANESSALCDLGVLDLHGHEPGSAKTLLDQAMGMASSHALVREEALVWLGEAQLLAAQQKTPEALAAIRSGQALAAQAGEVTTSALLAQEEGDLEARSGKDAEALAAYRKTESIWSGIPNLEHAALARASIARLEFRSGDLEAAQKDILLALDGFEASRRNIGGRSLRESYFASVHDFYDLAVGIDMRMGQGDATAEEAAWQVAERARARSLMDAIRGSAKFSARNLPGPLLERSAALEQRIAGLQQRIARLEGGPADAGTLQQAADRLHSLVLEAEDTESQERRLSAPSLFSAATDLPTLAALRRKLLAPDGALLEYWVGREDVDLWVVTPDSVRAVRIGAAFSVHADVVAYRDALLAREQFPANETLPERAVRLARADAALAREGAILGKLLLPARLPAAIHRLVIVPDGELASLPFAALRQSSGEYLIRHYEIVEEPSASVALELLARPGAAAGQNRIAVFADPVYNTFDPRLAAAEHRSSGLRAAAGSGPGVLRADFDLNLSELPRLNASSLEARSILAIAGASRVSSYLGLQATPRRAMEMAWQNFVIAHFATHAIVDSAHPEISGIVLSTVSAEGVPQDGVLWLHDIYRTPMPVSLVVLTGCRTASGKSIPGEGISSLAQAFLSSGAAGVLGALWSVDDRAAGEMIPWFYRALLEQHRSIAGALRAAQLRMLAQQQPAYAWAGYIVEGDAGAVIAARTFGAQKR